LLNIGLGDDAQQALCLLVERNPGQQLLQDFLDRVFAELILAPELVALLEQLHLCRVLDLMVEVQSTELEDE